MKTKIAPPIFGPGRSQPSCVRRRIGHAGAVQRAINDRSGVLACPKPFWALHPLGDRLGDRKRRLFAVACCRRIEELILRFKGAWRAVVLAERIADGAEVTDEAVRLRWRLPELAFSWVDGYREEKENQTMNCAGHAAADCLDGMVGPAPAFAFPPGSLNGVAGSAAGAVANWFRRNDREPIQKHRLQAEEAAQSLLLRDIFGNPFRPITFSPSWRTDTVLNLAQQMYEARDFSALPILADALQDAGCDNVDVLDHCRGSGPHVRGCWVVDLVLGKE